MSKDEKLGTGREEGKADGIEQIRQVMVRQMKAIPIGNYQGWNRYDTDFQHKLHVWADGKSYDIEVPRYPDGAKPKEGFNDNPFCEEYLD